ncbi:UPF0280 family protein [Desulfobotulus sp.]|jgi:ApbE superfamily uncharacterized protein (UPF0280 family)|uniref:UPF0280 family protein n=1 Tax=Desulfobotulus sp. TaxID=1940337 RepID=UPI002A36263C|nr:UPF0280 family protein [Desulfobotulus sp.]MDY0162962.1 UPF0280 family protein [Desulfobotulus sp.]
MHDPFASRNHYRRLMGRKDLVSFRITEKESDLHIQADTDLSLPARKELLRLRGEIRAYIGTHPGFFETFDPWPEDPLAPPVIRSMIRAGRFAGVGPMAAVAGAIAEALGRKLLRRSPEVLVENGGDLFVCSGHPLTLGLYAGDSPFSGKIAFRIPASESGMGICTSSGTLGHSFSFGRADAAVVIGPDTAMADALATAMGNGIHKAEDMDTLIEKARNIPEISAMILVKGKRLALCGDVEILPLAPSKPPSTPAGGERPTKRG